MRNRFLLAAILIPGIFSGGLGARENSSLLYEQGRQYARQGRYAEAGKIFQRVVELSPRYALGHYGLGRVFLATGGDAASAVRHLRLATELDASMPQAHFYLGMAYLLSEKYVNALHSFSDAYSRDSGYVESLYNIGVIYDRMGNRAKARLYYNRYNHEKERGRDQIF